MVLITEIFKMSFELNYTRLNKKNFICRINGMKGQFQQRVKVIYSSAKDKDKQTRLSMDKSFGVKSSYGLIDC